MYKDGKKIKGKMDYNDGASYEGEYVNDKFEGLGTYIWANGMKYEGEYKEDHMEGKGIMLFPDGRKYDGDW